MTSTNDLSSPLLGNLPRHEHEHERGEQDAEYDEEVCMLDHDSSSQEDSQDQQINCALAIVMSALLFLQFGIPFYMSPAEATECLRWSVVNYSIVLYVIAATLYRQSVKDCDISDMFYSATLLLPEILMDVMLCLVLFDKVVAAFLVLQFGILCLASLAVFVAASKMPLILVPLMTTRHDTADLKQPQTNSL
jgi:hypothetical protein